MLAEPTRLRTLALGHKGGKSRSICQSHCRKADIAVAASFNQRRDLACKSLIC
jgi:hypothetical protein